MLEKSRRQRTASHQYLFICGAKELSKTCQKKSEAQKSSVQTPNLKRKSTEEGSSECQPRKPKKPKPRVSKSDDKSASKGKGKEKNDYDSDQETFVAGMYEARSTGRERKPRKQEGMVPWEDIDPVTGLRTVKETNRSHGTAFPPPVGLADDDENGFKGPPLGTNRAGRYDSIGMELTSSTTRGERHQRLPTETKRFQDALSQLSSRHPSKVTVASSTSIRTNDPTVFEHHDDDPITEYFPDILDMLNSKTPAHNLFPAEDDETVVHNTSALTADDVTQPNTPTVFEGLLPTPTSNDRSASITPHHDNPTLDDNKHNTLSTSSLERRHHTKEDAL